MANIINKRGMTILSNIASTDKINYMAYLARINNTIYIANTRTFNMSKMDNMASNVNIASKMQTTGLANIYSMDKNINMANITIITIQYILLI